jgi:hypothetical protein
MSYRVYHDYDDDRDVITCVTLSAPGRWPARSTPAAALRRPSRWGRATAAGSCSSDGEPWHEKTCRDCEYYQP